MVKITRRAFLIGGAIVAAGILVEIFASRLPSPTTTTTLTSSVSESSITSLQTKSPDYQTFIAPNLDKMELLREYCMSPWNQSQNKIGYNNQFGLIEGDHFCLPTGEPVLTSTGLKPIEDIQIGEMVFTHKGRFRRVIETFQRDYSGEIVEIETPASASPLRVTPNHPILISNGSFSYPNNRKTRLLSSFQWVEAGQILKTDASTFLALPIPKEVYDKSEISVSYKINQFRTGVKTFPVNAAFMTIAGYYLAEGSEGSQGHRADGSWKNGHTQFQLGKGLMEFQYAFEITEAARELGLGSTMSQNKNGVAVIIYSTHLIRILKEQFGSRATGKRLPKWVLTLPNEKLEPLLRAYTNGDGHFESEVSYPVWTTRSVSRNLLEQMRLICLKLGYLTYLSKGSREDGTSEILGRNVTVHQFYDLRYTEKVRSHKGKASPWDEDFQYLRIRSIKRVEYSGKVHNLSVEEDNSYFCPSGVVHNCCGFNDGLTLFDPSLTIGTTLDYLNSLKGVSTNIEQTVRNYLSMQFVQGINTSCNNGNCVSAISYPYTYNGNDRRETLFGNKVDAIHGSVGYAFIQGKSDFNNAPTIEMEVVGTNTVSGNSTSLNTLCPWILLQYLTGNSGTASSAIQSILNDWNGTFFATYDPYGTCRDYCYALHMLRATKAWQLSAQATQVATQIDSQIWGLQNSDGGMRFSYSSDTSTGGEQVGLALLSHDPRIPEWF